MRPIGLTEPCFTSYPSLACTISEASPASRWPSLGVLTKTSRNILPQLCHQCATATGMHLVSSFIKWDPHLRPTYLTWLTWARSENQNVKNALRKIKQHHLVWCSCLPAWGPRPTGLQERNGGPDLFPFDRLPFPGCSPWVWPRMLTSSPWAPLCCLGGGMGWHRTLPSPEPQT